MFHFRHTRPHFHQVSRKKRNSVQKSFGGTVLRTCLRGIMGHARILRPRRVQRAANSLSPDAAALFPVKLKGKIRFKASERASLLTHIDKCFLCKAQQHARAQQIN